MDKKFDSRLKMFDASDDMLIIYATEWGGYTPMENAVEVFRSQRDAIMAAKQAQEKNLKEIAVNKEFKRVAMADIGMQVCGKVKAWCEDMGDVIGYGEMHITRSMVMNGRSTTAQTLCQSIYDKAQTMTAAERTTYNVLSTDLTLLQDCIVSYGSVKVSPRVAIASRKSTTDGFRKMFTDCTLTLKRRIDNLMENYAGTSFFNDWFNARRIVDAATEKANLAVTVLSDYDGSPLVGALVTGTDGVTTFEDMTDSQGKIKRSEIHSDLWQLTITHANFEGATVEADIYPGDKEKVVVKLKPV